MDRDRTSIFVGLVASSIFYSRVSGVIMNVLNLNSGLKVLSSKCCTEKFKPNPSEERILYVNEYIYTSQHLDPFTSLN